MNPERERLQAELARAEARLAALGREQAEVRACVDGIRRALAALAGSDGPTALDSSSTGLATPAAKIALFRSLFRGRADVFPRLWVNARKGTQGYAPVCANEWAAGLCQKPRVKCGECPARRFLPVDDTVLRDHLQGRHVIGVYPMLPDETCRLLAADFDGEGWKEDIGAFVETCAALDLPAAVERSRSGNGGHVWFFF